MPTMYSSCQISVAPSMATSSMRSLSIARPMTNPCVSTIRRVAVAAVVSSAATARSSVGSATAASGGSSV
jgi:hypothetical protein